jgi:hypothetical protein
MVKNPLFGMGKSGLFAGPNCPFSGYEQDKIAKMQP